ncbi:regulatory protein RecX [Microbacterium immunditiarum]|uniref:Regulatory protein RecX n=1 Tax=Microbacterium immunditiarum TaxID=337480 RepID=A0A7Y9GQF1_9MICO|nr:regulatory protein RecX [Microbacterium immunditiarum]NYE20773.1 regulatory protein [Microbacterium immunditiarum]
MVRFADDGGERRSAEADGGLAPVIPLFGGRTAAPAPQPEPEAARGDVEADAAWHPTWVTSRAEEESTPADDRDPDDDRAADAGLAEKALLKKLRTRSLSESEARGVLVGHGLDDAAAEDVLASMREYGYLDDAALAEQLIHAGVDRKGQGRRVIAQTLAKRGIPREIADAALAALPDDDLERALEFARTKARSLEGVDRDTALRRLAGQLARRGYGSVSLTAARMALDESPSAPNGVRFR